MNAAGLSGRPILLDSNLFVLLCVGLAGRSQIGRHKRLRSYDDSDFDLLSDVIGAASELVLCPNVATETSNISRQTNESFRGEISTALGRLIEGAREIHVESTSAVRTATYFRLGLTDAVLLEILRANARIALLTDDLDLYLTGAAEGLSAFNFNHLRN